MSPADWKWISVQVAADRLLTVGLVSLCISALIGLIYAFVFRKKQRQSWREAGWATAKVVMTLFMISVMGGLAGQLGGSSRESVVADLVPAVFVLLGGCMAYYLGEKKDPGGRIMVHSFSFLVCFFVAYNIAAVWRQDNEALDFCRTLYSNPEFKEQEHIAYRDHIWGTYCGSVMQRWSEPQKP